MSPAPASARPGAGVLISVLRGYRRWISPLMPPRCRFAPTCSEYAITAVERYGAPRGTLLALRRVSRCHPFHPGGHDPVPQRASATSSPSGAARC